MRNNNQIDLPVTYLSMSKKYFFWIIVIVLAVVYTPKNNNSPNFAVKGSIVSATPLGTGIIILTTKDVSVHDNTVKDHKTLNLAIVSYDMFSQENQEVSDENQQELLERGIQPISPDASIDPKV